MQNDTAAEVLKAIATLSPKSRRNALKCARHNVKYGFANGIDLLIIASASR